MSLGRPAAAVAADLLPHRDWRPFLRHDTWRDTGRRRVQHGVGDSRLARPRLACPASAGGRFVADGDEQAELRVSAFRSDRYAAADLLVPVLPITDCSAAGDVR